MILTNKQGLPESFAKAAAVFVGQRPEPRRIRVTDLIAPPQIRRLRMKHWDEITEDVSERIWAIDGQMFHAVLEQHVPADSLSEEKLSLELDGWTLSGTPDLYDSDGWITDWKTTSVYTVMGEDGAKGREEWHQQLNVYAVLFRAYGFAVKGLRIVARFRDWSRARADREPDYPQQQARVIEIPLWPEEDAKDYVAERLRLHAEAEADRCPQCSDDDRWLDPPVFAVKKRGAKRASRLCETREQAEKEVEAGRPAIYEIEERRGQSKRCQQYCNVAAFCPQWASLRASEGGEHAEV